MRSGEGFSQPRFWNSDVLPRRIPQYVAFSDLPHMRRKRVACTQPRRVAAMSVAKRVADELDVQSVGPRFTLPLASMTNPTASRQIGRRSWLLYPV